MSISPTYISVAYEDPSKSYVVNAFSMEYTCIFQDFTILTDFFFKDLRMFLLRILRGYDTKQNIVHIFNNGQVSTVK